jgi:hypothetical protein
MIVRFVKAVLMAGAAAAVIQSIPDVKRYLEIRSM